MKRRFALNEKGSMDMNVINKSNKDNYTDSITNKLNKKNVPYEIEEIKDEKIIWLDKDNNFCCRIDDIGADVFHLQGKAVFNLDEGENADLLTINDIIEHIIRIMTNELFQVETYKKNKLCSISQYIIINGGKISCSIHIIAHILFFLPFCKKEIKTTCYNYRRAENCF